MFCALFNKFLFTIYSCFIITSYSCAVHQVAKFFEYMDMFEHVIKTLESSDQASCTLTHKSLDLLNSTFFFYPPFIACYLYIYIHTSCILGDGVCTPVEQHDGSSHAATELVQPPTPGTHSIAFWLCFVDIST